MFRVCQMFVQAIEQRFRREASRSDEPAHHSGYGEPAVRIGELARRAGIPPATLRAWERRYGIVTPHRTEAGYRLYSSADERRLRSMVRLITEGLAPAEAAREALRTADSRRPSRRRSATGSPAGSARPS